MELPRTVTFDVTLDDVHEFDRHYAETAEAPKRARRAVRLALTALLASLLGALGWGIRAPLPFWALGAAILAVWWVVYPKRVLALTRANTERAFREGKNLGLLGAHRVTLDTEWITEATEEREWRTRWRAVEKVVESPRYLFVYVSGFSAVVVPRRAFSSEGEANEFVRACRALAANAPAGA